MIRFSCPTCGKSLSAPPEKIGAKANCPQCNQRVQIPEPPRNKTVLGNLVEHPLTPKSEIIAAVPAPSGVEFLFKWQPTLFRFGSPSFLVLALLMFPLPWINVSCKGTKVGSQSGLQAAYGGFSTKVPERKTSKSKDRPSFWSPWMLIYGILIVAGVAAGYKLHSHSKRLLIMTGITSCAFLCLLIQVMIGFPPERVVQSIMKEVQDVEAKQEARAASDRYVYGSETNTLLDFDLTGLAMLDFRFTLWFYVAFLGTTWHFSVWPMSGTRLLENLLLRSPVLLAHPTAATHLPFADREPQADAVERQRHPRI